MSQRNEWEIEITHDGLWPFKWEWKVVRNLPDYKWSIRTGSALSKDAAHRKVAHARLSMERDDVRIEEAA